jgi:imidazolonepropionase-like amidohydrolase
MAMPKLDPALNHFCKGTDDGMRQLSKLHASVLTGTDAPAPGTSYGASVHGELALFVREGLTPVEALAAATSAPAKCFHLSDRGAIRPGLRADLVLVEGDPTQNILATRNIVAVWKRGIRVQRASSRRRGVVLWAVSNHFNHNNLHLGEDDGFVAVNKDAVFDVPAHGA